MKDSQSQKQATEWPLPPTAREMIDWLGLFVAPLCHDRHNTAMYMAVRDVLVEHFGVLRDV